MKELIKRLKKEVSYEIKNSSDLDARSFPDEQGILLSVREANAIIRLYEQFNNVKS